MSDDQTFDPVLMKRRSRRAILFMSLLLTGFVIAFLVRGIDVFHVNGSRMSPAVENGDLIFASKSRGDLKRYDLVVFSLTRKEWSELPKRPDDEWQNPYVGRIVGLPGEVVEIRQGSILVDGQPVGSTNSNDEATPRRVPFDRYFVVTNGAGRILGSDVAPPKLGWASAEPSIDSTGKIIKKYRKGLFTRDDFFEAISGVAVLALFLYAMSLLRSRSGNAAIAVTLEVVAYLLIGGIFLVALDSNLPIYYLALVVNATLADFISAEFFKYSILVAVITVGSIYAGMQVLLGSTESSARRDD